MSPNRDEQPDLLWKIERTAIALDWSRSKTYEAARRGELPGVVRIGGTLRVHRPTLERWLETQVQAAAG